MRGSYRKPKRHKELIAFLKGEKSLAPSLGHDSRKKKYCRFIIGKRGTQRH